MTLVTWVMIVHPSHLRTWKALLFLLLELLQYNSHLLHNHNKHNNNLNSEY